MAPLQIRRAAPSDLPQIVDMLADDVLGQSREDTARPLARGYVDAFETISANPDLYLAVACLDGRPIGVLQLAMIRSLSRQGAWRGVIDGVRIASGWRGRGFGEEMVRWAIAQCRACGCATVQLTSDKARLDAHRFYQRLGFEPSHMGYTLDLG